MESQSETWSYVDGVITIYSQWGRQAGEYWFVTMPGMPEHRMKPTRFSSQLKRAIVEATQQGTYPHDPVPVTPADAVLLFLEGVIRLKDLEAATATASGLELVVTMEGSPCRILIESEKKESNG